jgi:unsaturated rhamnogalacturonyl hydrolase
MKNKHAFRILLVTAFTILFKHADAQTTSDSKTFRKPVVLEMMRKVADWQITNWQNEGFKKPKYNWTYGAAYTGIFA